MAFRLPGSGTCLQWALVICCVMLFSIDSAAYEGYPSPAEMYREIYDLKDKYPNLVKVRQYGRSTDGRLLLYMKITAPDSAEGKPEAMMAANIHGNEWIGNRVAMAAARRLVEGYGNDEWITALMDKMVIYFLPCLNPDGYQKTWDERDNIKAVPKEMRKNAAGVDINRNFPLPGEKTVSHSLAGSDNPESNRYTGSEPYSEDETKAIRTFVANHRLFAAIDFHSTWGTFFPPKCNSRACEKQFQKMMAPATEKQEVKYVMGQGRSVDSFSGEMEDALFYFYGIMAVCWEIMPASYATEQSKEKKHPFWQSNPSDIEFWIKNDVDAALSALESALKITGGNPIPEKHRKAK